MHHFTIVSKASHGHAYASVVDIMIMAAAAEIDSNLFMIFPFKIECNDNAMTKKPNEETASPSTDTGRKPNRPFSGRGGDWRQAGRQA